MDHELRERRRPDVAVAPVPQHQPPQVRELPDGEVSGERRVEHALHLVRVRVWVRVRVRIRVRVRVRVSLNAKPKPRPKPKANLDRQARPVARVHRVRREHERACLDERGREQERPTWLLDRVKVKG